MSTFLAITNENPSENVGDAFRKTTYCGGATCIILSTHHQHVTDRQIRQTDRLTDVTAARAVTYCL